MVKVNAGMTSAQWFRYIAQFSKEERRSMARTLIASAYVHARKASGLVGIDRRAERTAGMDLISTAQRLYRLPTITELGAMVACNPEDSRLRARLENARKLHLKGE